MERALSSPGTFDALPPALHLSVILHLPLVARVRCALVSKRWAALLREPEVWAELSFEGASEQFLDSEVLEGLVRRAAGKLRLLDLSCVPDQRSMLRRGGEYILPALAAEGLLGRLEVLSAAAHVTIKTADDACRLLDSCPSLKSARVLISGIWPDAIAAMRLLPLAEGVTVKLFLTGGGRNVAPPCFVAFATAVADALEHSPPLGVIRLDPLFGGSRVDCDLKIMYDRSTATASAKAQASTRLAAALADPLRGPDTIEDSKSGFGKTPTFAEMCRLLTPESRLRRIDLENGKMNNDGAVALADALASGRGRRIDSVHIGGGDLSAGGGCALLSALAANTSLTRLKLRVFDLGGDSGEAAAALLAALPRNTTLRDLQLVCFGGFCGAGAAAAVFAALGAGARGGDGSSSGSSSGTGLAVRLEELIIDAAAAAALGDALGSGYGRMTGLTLRCCTADDCDEELGEQLCAEISRGLMEGGSSAVLRELVFEHCNIIPLAGVEALARALREPSCPLESLSLEGSEVGDAGGVALALALCDNASHSHLRKLNLASCGLGDATPTALGAALAAQGGRAVSLGRAPGGADTGGGLRELDLAHNKAIGHAGALALAWGIRQAGAWLESVNFMGAGGPGFAGVLVGQLLREAAEAWLLRHRSAGREPNKALTVKLRGMY